MDELRRDLSYAWQFLAHVGLTDTIFNHISVSIREGESNHQFLVNPWDKFAIDCAPEDFVLCEDGKVFSDLDAGRVNDSALVLHGVLQSIRQGAIAIIHLHSPGAMALAAMQEQLLPLNQLSMEFFDDMAYIPYSEVIETEAEAKRIVSILGDRKVALLMHHGLLAIGDSLPEAVYLAYYLEQACRIQIAIMSCNGAHPTIPPTDVTRNTAMQLRTARARILPIFWQGVKERASNLSIAPSAELWKIHAIGRSISISTGLTTDDPSKD